MTSWVSGRVVESAYRENCGDGIEIERKHLFGLLDADNINRKILVVF